MLRSIRLESDRSQISAVFIQDHRLEAKRDPELRSLANQKNLLAIAAYAPPHPTNKLCYGGTMIIIPYESIDLDKGEDIHTACARIRQTMVSGYRGSWVSADLSIEGKSCRPTAVYAPPRGCERPAFFKRLKRKISSTSIIGIDANCVPDITKDLKRTATSPYDNRGAAELLDLVDTKGLIDVVRETSGTMPIFSAEHCVRNGHVCWSRIDQIYAPMDNDVQWTPAQTNDFFTDDDKPKGEIDHSAVEVTSTKVKPEKGNDLPRINEDIFNDPRQVEKLIEIVTDLKDKIDTTHSRMAGANRGKK